MIAQLQPTLPRPLNVEKYVVVSVYPWFKILFSFASNISKPKNIMTLKPRMKF